VGGGGGGGWSGPPRWRGGGAVVVVVVVWWWYCVSDVRNVTVVHDSSSDDVFSLTLFLSRERCAFF
jgi:hypothetical protein